MPRGRCRLSDAVGIRLTRAGGNPPDPGAALRRRQGTRVGNAPSGARLRAALYEVLADSPNLRLVGHVKDGAGRSGTAVDLQGPGWSSRMIIDPTTYQLLEASTVAPSNDPTSRVLRITYLSAGPAEHAPRPDPGRLTQREHGGWVVRRALMAAAGPRMTAQPVEAAPGRVGVSTTLVPAA
jgi:hypothetical protein